MSGMNVGSGMETRNLIAVMGATGSGKSSFLNTVSGMNLAEVGHTSDSCTKEIGIGTFVWNSHLVKLVDTPGFDDTELTDTEILKRIATWMEIRFTGILYLREITETRMRGTAIKNLNMFRKLCGTDTLQNVVLITTKWDKVSVGEGEQHEDDLRAKHWKVMLDQGARLARHDNTAVSGQRILRGLLGSSQVTLNIQRQLVDHSMQLENTDAGTAVNEDLIATQRRLRAEMEDNIRAIRSEQDAAMKAAYQEHQAELEAQCRKFEAAQQQLREDRSKEIERLQQKLDEAAAKAGKQTSDYIWEGAFGLAGRLVDSGVPLIAESMRNAGQGGSKYALFHFDSLISI